MLKHNTYLYCTMEIIALVLLLCFATRPNSVYADYNDMIGLGNLQQALFITGTADQDPCLWSWIQCDSSNNLIRFSRVIAINLSNSNLKGELPDFSMMDALEKIDFHGNNLYGPIPDFLGTKFPNLTKLDLSNNDFSGLVPVSVSNLTNSIDLSLVGNSNLCVSEPCETYNNRRSATSNNVRGSTTDYYYDSDGNYYYVTPSSHSSNVVVYYTVSPAFIIWCIAGAYFIYKHREKVALAIQQGRMAGADQGGVVQGIAMGVNVGPRGERDHVPLNPV